MLSEPSSISSFIDVVGVLVVYSCFCDDGIAELLGTLHRSSSR